jgi:ribosome-associated translation inhibitor RaiA
MHLRVRGVNLEVRRELRTSIERRLWFALGRFAPRIGRVTVSLAKQSSPDRTSEKRCRIIVCLIPAGRVQLEETDIDLGPVVERATHRVGQLVRREIERQREQSDLSATETHTRQRG